MSDVTHTDQLTVWDYLREIAIWADHGAFFAAKGAPSEETLAYLGKHFLRLKEMAETALLPPQEAGE